MRNVGSIVQTQARSNGSAPREDKGEWMYKFSVFILVLLAGCGAEPLELPAPVKAVALAATHHRISITPIGAAAPAEQWRTQVVALYSPLDSSQPGTSTESTSYSNCKKSSGVVFVPLPNLFPCTRSFSKTLERQLPASQIQHAGGSVLVNFEPVVTDGGARYLIRELYLDYRRCSGDCPMQRLQLDLRCYRADASDEVVGGDLLLRYQRGATASAEAAECALKRGEWPGWYQRDTVMPILKGHFGEDDYGRSDTLLSAYSAVPTAKGGWLPNPAYGRNHFRDLCPLEKVGNGYEVADGIWRLSPADGWPFDPQVEVRRYRPPGRGLCAIELEGHHSEGELQHRVRYFYEFTDGQLMQVRSEEQVHIEEPGDIQRTWRFEGGKPLEYIYRNNDSSGDGREVRYWHRIAAEQWPKQMNYQPDMAEFERMKDFAARLANRSATLQPAP